MLCNYDKHDITLSHMQEDAAFKVHLVDASFIKKNIAINLLTQVLRNLKGNNLVCVPIAYEYIHDCLHQISEKTLSYAVEPYQSQACVLLNYHTYKIIVNKPENITVQRDHLRQTSILLSLMEA